MLISVCEESFFQRNQSAIKSGVMQGYLSFQYHVALVEQRVDVQLKCGIMGIFMVNTCNDSKPCENFRRSRYWNQGKR